VATDPYAVFHEGITWLGAGGGGAALVHLGRLWVKARKALTVPEETPLTGKDVERVRKELAAEYEQRDRQRQAAAEKNDKELQLLRQELEQERQKRHEMMQDWNNYVRQEEETWRRWERALGRMEGVMGQRMDPPRR